MNKIYVYLYDRIGINNNYALYNFHCDKKLINNEAKLLDMCIDEITKNKEIIFEKKIS